VSHLKVFAQWSEQYLEAGFSVIPILPKEKRPAIKSWQQYCDRHPTEFEIKSWIVQFGHCNIGLCMGKASGVVGFDFDYEYDEKKCSKLKVSKEAFDLDRIEVEKMVLGFLPPSAFKKIGAKGWTAFYKFSDQKNYSPNRNGVRVFDFLSTGRQTVIPPSIHMTTEKPYFWVDDDLMDGVGKLNDLSDQLVSSMNEMLMTSEGAIKRGTNGRHGTIFSRTIKSIESFESVSDMVNFMMQLDVTEHEEPYFSDSKHFPSVSDPTSNAEKWAKRLINWYRTFKAKKNEYWEFGKETSSSKIISKEDRMRWTSILHGFYFRNVSDKGRVTFDPDFYGLSSYIGEKFPLVAEDGYTFIYRKDHYETITKTGLDNLIIRVTNRKVKPTHIDQYKRILCGENHIIEKNFSDNEGLLNVENGILQINSGQVFDHSFEYFFKYKVPIEFDPKAKCERWLKFLDEIFESDQELVDLTHEIFGYCLLGGDPFLHKAFCLIGDGRNGKSTWMDVLKNLLGWSNVTGVPLLNLDKPFSVVTLDGKLANICEETPTDKIPSESFKAVTAGGEILAAQKGSPEYMLPVTARFIFASNDLPYFQDTSIGMIDRLVFLPFNVYFSEKERDTGLKKKLFGESSGILNLAIDGARRVLDKGLTKPARSQRFKKEYREETDIVFQWFEKYCQIVHPKGDQTAEVSTDTFYHYFMKDMQKETKTQLSKKAFGRRLKRIVTKECQFYNVPFISKGRLSSRVRGYKEIKYTNTEQQTMNTEVQNNNKWYGD